MTPTTPATPRPAVATPDLHPTDPLDRTMTPTTTASPPDRADRAAALDTALDAALAEAAAIVAPVWPLERFVAVNPLIGLLDAGFPDAVQEARRWLGARGLPGAPAAPPAPRTCLEAVDPARSAEVGRLVARWCALLLDPHGVAAGRDDLWGTWRDLASRDRALRLLVGRPLAASLRSAADGPDEAIVTALSDLGVDEEDWPAELRGQFARVPGWAGYARWCDEWAGPADPAPRLSLRLLAAMALTVDALVVASLGANGIAPAPHQGPAADPAPDDATALALAAAGEGLVAAEAAYRANLLAALDGDPADGPAGPVRPSPAAQVVCCIDVRSEPLRRHLEAVGPYETLGFAGFFGTPVRFRPLGAAEAYPSAPVLLHPEVEVVEAPDPRDPRAAEGELTVRRRRAAAAATLEDLAHDPVAMYALAETAGWVAGPVALARTVAPGLVGGGRTAARTTGTIVDPAAAFTLDERIGLLEGALRTMGLTSGFAPLVVLCGHGSTTTANAHAAALDCGACGGNHGGPNARALVAVANDPEVRSGLVRRGIVIGASTWFVAAEHDTTTDEVVLLDVARVPATHRAAVEALTADLGVAGERVAAERLTRLPAGTRRGPRRRPSARSARRAVAARSRDWAETRPEWGLAGNAAFVVGPRSLTAGVDLGGRTFLHSYDAARDPDGGTLATILTAPMVVAHWINAQYFFSSVDPDVFGAGDKAQHNPVAGVGVLTGDGGDLRVGLPWQSVAGPDGLVHEPLRLLTVVAAPIDRIERVIADHPILQQLFDGAWVHLVARGSVDEPWLQRRPGGAWVPARADAAGEARP